jgi:outer membrane protein
MKARHFSAVVPLACATAAFCSGCVSPPVPAGSAAPWSPPDRARKPDTVWAELRTPAVDFSKPLPLAALADIALGNNPATRKAWSDARAAAAQVEETQSYFLPTVAASASATRQRTTAEPPVFNQNYLRYTPALQLNYLVLNFGGGRGAAVEAALQSVYAADFAFNRSLQDVLLAVETAYYGLISAQGGLEAAEAAVRDAKTALEAAQQRNAFGLGTQLDVLQAQAATDQALYNLADAEGQLAIAHGGLAQSIGVAADTPIQIAAPATDLPEGLAAADMRRMIDDALQRRPDIAALRATLAAREALVKVAGARLWPSLYLNGEIKRDDFTIYSGGTSQGGPVLSQPEQSAWSYNGGVSLQWTLFDGFQTASAKRTAAAQADSAREQLKQAELAASADVWTQYHAYQTALKKSEFSAAFLNSASAAYELALDSYKGGLKSILDLLTSEVARSRARSQAVAARQEAYIALANFAHAVGLLDNGGAMQITDLLSTTSQKDQKP